MSRPLPKLDRKQWLERLKDAQKEPYVGWHKRAKQYRQYYQGANLSPSLTPSVIVNTLFKDVKASIPKIFAKNPDVVTRPANTSATALFMADYSGSILPYYQKELRLKRTINRCLLDAKISGFGIVKFGWSYETAEEEVAPDVFEQMDDAQKSRVTVKKLTDGQEQVTQQIIMKDEPWVLRWPPQDVVIDPEASSPDLTDARWIAFRKMMPLDEGEGLFGKLAVKDARAKETRSAASDKSTNTDFHRLTFWEVFDKLRQERRLFIEEVEEFEKSSRWEVDVDGFPAETIFFNETPDDPYGDPDVRFYEGQLIEQNDIRTQQTEHRRSYNAQTLYEEDAIDETEVAKARENVSNSWVKIRPQGLGKIGPRPIPPLPTDLYNREGVIKQDISEIIGSENQLGTSSNREQTATEASITESRSRTRDAERQDAVEDFYHRITVKIWTVLRQKLPRARVEEILGRLAPAWENVSGMAARKELEIEIKTNSTLPKLDRQVLIQQNIQLMTLLQQMSPSLAMQGRQVNIAPLLEETLELMNQKAKAEQILPPAAPMMGVMPGLPGGRPTGAAIQPSEVMGPEQMAERLGARGMMV